MPGKTLKPIGYVDENGRYYSYEEIHPYAEEIEEGERIFNALDPEAQRWINDWARRQVERAYDA